VSRLLLILVLPSCAGVQLGYPIPERDGEEELFDEDWGEDCLEEKEPNDLSSEENTDFDYLGLLSEERALSWCGSTSDDDVDSFVFELRERGTVLLELEGDAELQLQDFEGEVLGSRDSIRESLAAGLYLGFVYTEWGSSDYRLELSFD
jgi:hypothetical protein